MRGTATRIPARRTTTATIRRMAPQGVRCGGWASLARRNRTSWRR